MSTLDRFGLLDRVNRVEPGCPVQKSGGNAGLNRVNRENQVISPNHLREETHTHTTHVESASRMWGENDLVHPVHPVQASNSAGFGEPGNGITPAAPGSNGMPPRDWIDGVARLADMPTPAKFPAASWAMVVADTNCFLGTLATNAHRLGWQDWELFGCHRQAPWHRIQGLGLVPLLQGDAIVALTSTEAAVRTKTGAMQTFRRKQADPLYPAERCLIWELSHE